MNKTSRLQIIKKAIGGAAKVRKNVATKSGKAIEPVIRKKLNKK